MGKIEKDFVEFLANLDIAIDPEWLDDVELNDREELFLAGIQEKRLSELSEALEQKMRLKEVVEQPRKAQNFHLFFQYFKEFRKLDNTQISKAISIEQKYLDHLIDLKNNIIEIPSTTMVKLLKFMELSLADSATLIRHSYKLGLMKPVYSQYLSRSHDQDPKRKSSSVNRAINELLLKSKRAKSMQTDEIEDYIKQLEHELKE